jgi:hypothetical protein
MSTIDSKEIVKVILDNDGVYPGDRACKAVYTYMNNWRNRTYYLVYDIPQLANFLQSPAVHNPELLWNDKFGLTNLGHDMFYKGEEA